MDVSAINAGSRLPASDLQRASAPSIASIDSNSGPSFAGLLQNMVQDASSSQAAVDSQTQRLLTGESSGFHELSIAVARADLSFQFLLGVRDQLIGAYREVMRMQV